MADTPDGDALLAAARGLAPFIRECREEIERERRLPPTLAERMRQAGMFQLWLPAALGGPELHPHQFIRAIQELARADGSVGWCAALTSVWGLLAPGLPDARPVFGDRQIVAGAVNPPGKAVASPGGYRVSGRWAYGSGVDIADWMIVGCAVQDGETPRLLNGAPQLLWLFLPRDAVEVIDTWRVSGLRGSGSHTIQVADLFVPEARGIPAFPSFGMEVPPLYRMPLIGMLTVALAAIALGIARAAIEALIVLANAKTPMASPTLLRDKPAAQINIGHAEALTGAAEAFLLAAVGAQWDEIAGGRPPSLAARARVRAAATHAGEACARAVDLMHETAGGSAIFESCPIERCFRDIHAATQHIGLSANTYEYVGRVSLGLDPGTPRF